MISRDLWRSIEGFCRSTLKAKQSQQSNLYRWRRCITKDRWKSEYQRVRCPTRGWVTLVSSRSSQTKAKPRPPKRSISRGTLSSRGRNQEVATSQRRWNTNLWAKVSWMWPIEQSTLAKWHSRPNLPTTSSNSMRYRLLWSRSRGWRTTSEAR